MYLDGILDIFKPIKKFFADQKIKREAKKYAKQNKPLTKEQATAQKKAWVAVLDTHVNPDNIRNGFFELDWNEYFIVDLRAAGFTGQTEEEVVDAWFVEMCNNLAQESNINMNNRGSGYVQRALRDDGKVEIS